MAVDPASPAAHGGVDVDFDALDLAWLQAKPGAKWQRHGPDRLAAWVADMDFPTPPPVVAERSADSVKTLRSERLTLTLPDSTDAV